MRVDKEIRIRSMYDNDARNKITKTKFERTIHDNLQLFLSSVLVFP